MNRTHYSKDEEEFDLNEGFAEPYSIHYTITLNTPIKRKKALIKGAIKLFIDHN